MSFNLLIVESPVKQKTIQQYLNGHIDSWIVFATRGHILGLHKNGFSEFAAEPFWKEVNSPLIASILKGSDEVDKIYIGTDLDREGESIAWHISSILLQAFPEKPIFRIRYNQITKDTLWFAIANPENFDWNLNEAQIARRLIDRAIGFAYSKIVQKIFKCRRLSVGRVQSAVLGMLVSRELKKRKFKSKNVFRVIGKLTDGTILTSRLLKNESYAKKILDNIRSLSLKFETNKKEIIPPPPFNTASLLQHSAVYLGFPTAVTTKLLQRLFQTGMISYIRTTSININPRFAGSVKSHIEKILPGYTSNIRYIIRDNNSPHEAIRPTSIKKLPSEFLSSSEEKRLYNLIWVRTIISQSKPIEILEQHIFARLGTKCVLSACGGKLLFDGWIKTSMGMFGTAPRPIDETAKIKPETFNIRKEKTQPLKNLTEASLIRLMEKKDLGQPSTYGYILNRLKAVGYIQKSKNIEIEVSEKGISIYLFLKEKLNQVIRIKSTRAMEDDLLAIEKGEVSRQEILKLNFKVIKETSKSIDIKVPIKAREKCKTCKVTLIVTMKPKTMVPLLQCPICSSDFKFKREE